MVYLEIIMQLVIYSVTDNSTKAIFKIIRFFADDLIKL